MLNGEYFTEQEAIEDVIEVLENNYNGYYCDLHNEVFNTDYYIIGTYESKNALEQYGVFGAIEKVQEYEKDNFGEVYTDLSNPEKIANMLYYIIGEEVMQNSELVNDVWNDKADEETNKKIVEEFKEYLNN